jgi:GTP-binding protein EngB required for normal cell division
MSTLVRVLDELTLLLTETASYHSDAGRRRWAADAHSLMVEAVEQCHQIRRRLLPPGGRVRVAVAGLVNTGKSTLMNALLGAPLLPAENRPLTAAPTEFEASERLSLVLHPLTGSPEGSFRRRTKPVEIFCASQAELSVRLAELVRPDHPGLGEIGHIAVGLPKCSLLTPGLILVDTPGWGAAKTGDDGSAHHVALQRYLKEHEDSTQIVWTLYAPNYASNGEKDFFEAHIGSKCCEIVLTEAREVLGDSGALRARFRDRFYPDVLGVSPHDAAQRYPALHFVEAKAGLEARLRSDIAGYEASGVAELERSLKGLADPRQREYRAAEPLRRMAHDLRHWLGTFRDHQGALPVWWRPDSFARFVANGGGSQLHAELVSTLTQPASSRASSAPGGVR